MTPKLTLFVRISGGPQQAENTLYALSQHCQKNVSPRDYEIVAVEAATDPEALGEARVRTIGSNVRHVSFEHASSIPASLQAHALTSQTPLLGFVDGSCLVTPTAIAHVLAARRLADHPLIVIPAYEIVVSGDTSPREQLDWKRNADELYARCRFSQINQNGYLCGVSQARAFFCALETYRRVCSASGAAPRSSDELFSRLCALGSSRLIVLGGEACFLDPQSDRVAAPADLFQRPNRQPLLFGEIPEQARPFLRLSLEREAIYEALSREGGREPWPHDRNAMRATVQSVQTTAEPERVPLISVIVVVSGIGQPVENTLYSLCAQYQRNVREQDYEVIVVESRSRAMFGRERALRTGSNIRYFESDPAENVTSALYFGLEQAQAPTVGILLDGARVLTPGVIEQALLARRLDERLLCVVPGYHLEPTPVGDATELENLAWRESGYRLFERAVAADPPLDSVNSLRDGTCLFCPKTSLAEIRGAAEHVHPSDSGSWSDLFAKLYEIQATQLVVLWSEGTFHQYLRAISVRSATERSALTSAFFRYVARLRGQRYQPWTPRAKLLGSCAAPATELLRKAKWLELGSRRNGGSGSVR